MARGPGRNASRCSCSTQRLRQQQIDDLPDQLRSRVAELTFQLAIDEHDLPLGVDDQDATRRRLDRELERPAASMSDSRHRAASVYFTFFADAGEFDELGRIVLDDEHALLDRDFRGRRHRARAAALGVDFDVDDAEVVALFRLWRPAGPRRGTASAGRSRS